MGMAGWGALAGAAQAGAGVATSMIQEDMLQKRLEAQERIARLNADSREGIALQRLQAQGGGGGRGGSGGVPLERLLALSQDPGALAALRTRMGGMTPDRAAALAEIEGGRTPGQEVETMRAVPQDTPGDPSEVVTQKEFRPKYSPGETAAVVEEGRVALRRALGLTDLGASDNIANAEKTEAGVGFARGAAAGDKGAARGALALAGRAEYDTGGSSLVTGLPATGSVDEALVKNGGKKGGGKGGGAGPTTVQKTYVDGSGNMVAVMRDGTQRVLGPAGALQGMIAKEKAALAKTVEGIGLSPADLEARAVATVMGRAPAPAAAPGAPRPATGTSKLGSTWRRIPSGED